MIPRIFTTVLLSFLLAACVGSGVVKPKARQHYTLGLSYLQSANPTLALREFLKAVANNPKDAQAHAGLARAYQIKKSYALAEQQYKEALKLSDNEPEYQNNLAVLYLSMDRWDQAITYFNKAAENLLFVRPELALTGKGYAYYRKGDYPSALKAYREAAEIAPRLPTLFFHMGETYAAFGHPKLAIAAYKKALFYAPNYSVAGYQLAILLLKANQIDAAKKYLQRLVKQDPFSKWGEKATAFLETLK